MFKRGDSATVVQNNYVEPGERTFVGETGTVKGTVGDAVVVQFPGETRSYGFMPEEVERTK